MIRHLDRYVAKQFVVTFAVLVLGLPLLFIITDITENLDQHFARGISTGSIALSYLFYIPQFVVWSLPIAALVGTVFTVGAMTRHQEVVAAKAGGVSFYRLVAPIFVLGAVLSLIALALNEVVPVTNQIRAELIGERQTWGGTLRSDFIYVTEGGHVLAARRLEPASNRMSGVILEQRGRDGEGHRHAAAHEAVWTPETGWRLQNGFFRYLDENRGETTFEFAEMVVPHLSETPEELMAEPKDPDEMRYDEMSRFIAAIERSGGDSRPMRTERAQKISLPLAVAVIILFGAPLATSSKRGGAAYGIGVSLAVTMAYLLLFRVGSAMGASGSLPPLAAAWLPNLIFLAAGIVLLGRVRT